MRIQSAMATSNYSVKVKQFQGYVTPLPSARGLLWTNEIDHVPLQALIATRLPPPHQPLMAGLEDMGGLYHPTLLAIC